jgi:hypothetical protein
MGSAISFGATDHFKSEIRFVRALNRSEFGEVEACGASGSSEETLAGVDELVDRSVAELMREAGESRSCGERSVATRGEDVVAEGA